MSIRCSFYAVFRCSSVREISPDSDVAVRQVSLSLSLSYKRFKVNGLPLTRWQRNLLLHLNNGDT